jgi:pSer/pThr/pTyr-binding forkhead associated (FHA) protein
MSWPNSETGVSTASNSFSSNDVPDEQSEPHWSGRGSPEPGRNRRHVIRLNAVIEIEGQAPRALTHESTAQTIILGRDASADFQIPLSTISRQHARIVEQDGLYVIEDLGSTHGTTVAGKKLSKGEKKVLKDGDVIELTKAKVKIAIESDRLIEAVPGEGTKAIAARAVVGILGKLGEAQGEQEYFRVLNGADEGTRFVMQGGFTEWSFGRSKDCEFVLNDPNVSRKHARVKRDWNNVIIEDLGSKNGVLVNDQLVKKTRKLRDRDEITIGPVKLVYINPDADLLKAIEDVPGFQKDDPSEAEAEASVMGAPDDGLQPHEGGGTEGGEIPEPLPGEGTMDGGGYSRASSSPGGESMGEMDHIDPDLLDERTSKVPFEWIVIGLVTLLIFASVTLILAILT